MFQYMGIRRWFNDYNLVFGSKGLKKRLFLLANGAFLTKKHFYKHQQSAKIAIF